MAQLGFDKQVLVQQVIQQLEVDLAALIEAAKANLEAATNEESKPENEYDTRALEAGYIAGAQSQRARDIEEALSVLKQLKLRNFSKHDPIGVSSLVELEHEGDRFWVFLLPRGAGITLTSSSVKVRVITGQSPLGQALLQQSQGEVVILETAKGTQEYEILQII